MTLVVLDCLSSAIFSITLRVNAVDTSVACGSELVGKSGAGNARDGMLRKIGLCGGGVIWFRVIWVQ